MNDFVHNSSAASEVNGNVENHLSQTPPTNPFEVGIDRLHLPSVSPTVFSVIETPNKADKSFRWSIDQIAVLHPADIDVKVAVEHAASKVDHEVEKKAQEAINMFFSQSQIVPSPWLASNVVSARTRSLAAFSPSMSAAKHAKNSQSPTSMTDGDYLTCLFRENKHEAESRELQGSDEDSKDSLSISGLRRKLFFSSSTDSNMKGCSSSSTPPVSPLRNTPFKKIIPSESGGSTQFSSSPIAHIVGRSSITPPVHFSPPPVSPIRSMLPQFQCSNKKQNCRTPETKGNISFDEMSSISFRGLISSGTVGKIYDVMRTDNSMKASLEEEMATSYDGNAMAQLDAGNTSRNPSSNSNQLYSSDMEYFPTLSNQDTGYNTNSLQVTNCESMQVSFLLQGSGATSSQLCSQGNFVRNTVQVLGHPDGDRFGVASANEKHADGACDLANCAKLAAENAGGAPTWVQLGSSSLMDYTMSFNQG